MSFEVPFNLGWLRGRGKAGARGGMIKARNSRFHPKHPQRLWALLGRSAYNSSVIPGSTLATTDDSTVKNIFPVFFDDGTKKLVAHKGGTLFEGDLAATGAFSQVQVMAQSGSDIVPRGIPAAYRGDMPEDHWYYPTGRTGWDSQYHLWARSPSGWLLAGHLTPTAAFTAAEGGAGAISSSETIKYTYRIYDSTTDTESAHGPVVSVTTFSSKKITLTFASGVALLAAERGDYVRIYRTLLDEEAGIYYRVDPQMTDYDGTNGIPLASFTAGYTTDDEATNTQAQLNGTVRADGEEGSLSWGEHGGPPPQAGGCMVYSDQLVMFDINGRPNDIIYSAVGYPECFPVDFDGDYQYYLRFQSDKVDRILRVLEAGNYLLAMGEHSIFRATLLPTFEDPGFSRIVQDTVTKKHGICGRYAADSFGIGADRAQRVLYVSRDHDLMVTDGVNAEPVLRSADFKTLVADDYWPSIEVRDYPLYQELWVFYSATQALIVSYAQLETVGLRVTGPIDVKGIAACYAAGTDSIPRFYLTDASSRKVYVQDSGSTDEQQNTNSDGDIQLQWDTARYTPGGARRLKQIHEAVLSGIAGSETEFKIRHFSIIGQDENEILEKAVLGPDETDDQFAPEHTGVRFREELSYLGPTGSEYPAEEDSATTNAPPGIDSITYEYSDQGPLGRTREDASSP